MCAATLREGFRPCVDVGRMRDHVMRILAERIQERLALEHGTLFGQGRRRWSLIYPSPYAVGMSSLGFQTVYRLLNALPDTVAERAFLPEADLPERAPLWTYESGRPAADAPVVAFSVAYELELMGVFECLRRLGVAALSPARQERDPIVVMGGPLTSVNPRPLGPFADLIVVGEAEAVLAPLTDALFGEGSRAQRIARAGALPGVWLPAQVAEPPAPLEVVDACLPAFATIWTPASALANMFLVEAERGCARGCAFCVMRRQAGRGMRCVPAERVLQTIPNAAPRVGLVGAAVSDHPDLVAIVRAIVDAGQEVGLSSLRADRLSSELVALLVKGGNRTLTVAADGISERLRTDLSKRIEARHLHETARLAAEFGVPQLKLYAMVGVPGETPADVAEFVTLCRELRTRLGPLQRLTVGVSVFVPKPRTPLVDAAFVGIKAAEAQLASLKRQLRGIAELSTGGGRQAWLEGRLAHGNQATGVAMYDAYVAGGGPAAIRKALGLLGAEGGVLSS